MTDEMTVEQSTLPMERKLGRKITNLWSEPQREAAKAILTRFANSKSGSIDYSRVPIEAPELWDLVYTQRGGDVKAHRQLQQRISYMRCHNGSRVRAFKQKRKVAGKLGNTHTEAFKKFQLGRSILEPKIKEAILEKKTCKYCPNCGISLVEVDVAMNMRKE